MYDAALTGRTFEDVYIRSAHESLFIGCAYVEAARCIVCERCGYIHWFLPLE